MNTQSNIEVRPSFRHAAELVYVLVATGAIELANARSIYGVVARLAELFARCPMYFVSGYMVAGALVRDDAVAELFASDEDIDAAIEGVLEEKAVA